MANRAGYGRAALAMFLTLGGAAAVVPPKAATTAPQSRNKANAAVEAAKKHGTLNLNGASKAELLKLPRMNAALADKIIAGRPYQSKFQLLSRATVPNDVFAAIRMKIEVRPVPKSR